MPSFTYFRVFGDTLPIADRKMKIEVGVSIGELRHSMQDWCQQKGYIPKDSHLTVRER